MKSQQISSLPFSDSLGGIEFPTAVKAEMGKPGENFSPLMKLTTDPSLQIKKREPMRERELSTTEFLNMFDHAESLKMVYLPHFITQCVIYYVDLLIDYARSNRLSDYRKHTQKLRNIKDDYIAALRHEMPAQVFQQFLTQREEYLASCGSNLNLIFFTFNNLLLKRYGRIDNDILCCYANIIIAFTNYVEDFDKEVNKRIAKKLRMPCRNYGDTRLTAIKDVCNDIACPYLLEKNKDTMLCVDVIANKALVLINKML